MMENNFIIKEKTMKSKLRIVKRIEIDGRVKYIIQHRFLFRWWLDVLRNVDWPNVPTSFDTLEKAKEHLCYFDGTKSRESVVFTVEKEEPNDL